MHNILPGFVNVLGYPKNAKPRWVIVCH